MSFDSSAATGPHLRTDVLLDYWFGDSAAVDAIDEHLMQCDACGRALDELVALGRGIRDAVRAGNVGTVAGARFVQRLADRGLRVREYRVPPGGSVDCSVAPDDELLVSRLQLPPQLQGVQRLDLHVELSLEPGVRHQLRDIPFDPQGGEVVWINRLAAVRPRPAHTARVTLLAVDDAGAHEVGRYEFNHRP